MQNEKSSLSPIDIKYLIVNIDEKNVDNILFIHAASDLREFHHCMANAKLNCLKTTQSLMTQILVFSMCTQWISKLC